MLKKVIIGTAMTLALLAAFFVIFVGPWPAYEASDIQQESYYKAAIETIDAKAAESSLDEAQAPLRAGWGKARITPPIGTPLAGYGQRQGKPSTGVHDELYVKALALSDGKDTVVIVGSDLLIVPNNVADIARERAAAKTPLTPNDILFNATHTHSGPGAWGPGYAAAQFAGSYDEAIVLHLGTAFGDAIVAAYEAMEPAEWARGRLEAPQYIRNRVRDAETDSRLSYLVVRQQDGDLCHLVSYSAHSTVIGASNMEFCGDYPGYLQRRIEQETAGLAIFLAGAVGSMGPRIDGPDGFTKARTMGEALAAMVLEDCRNPVYRASAEIASVGFPFKTPPIQLRFSPDWRVSPYLVRMLGVDDIAWAQGVRIGEVFLYGTPCDMSGELSAAWKRWADGQGLDLWVLSFDGDYIGYVSPQKYYETATPNGEESYEMYLMSWIGPNREPFFEGLLKHMVARLVPVAS